MKRILVIALALGCALQGIAQDKMMVPHRLPVSRAVLPTNAGVRSGVPYQQPALLTVYAYDSVRALTELNTPTSEAFTWLSPDGLRLYYRACLDPNLYPAPIFLTQRADTSSMFAPPVQVMVSDTVMAYFSLSNDELDIYFIGDTVKHAHRSSTGQAFSQAKSLTLNHPFTDILYFNGVTLDPTQNQLFCSLSDPASNYRLCEFSRTSATSFNFVREIILPSGYLPTVGQLSKDGLTFFVDADDINNSTRKIYQLSRAALADSFHISTFQEVQGLNDASSAYNGLASMSDNLDWVAFVRSGDGSYDECELFLAHRSGSITAVATDLVDNSLSVFPNPSAGRFRLRSNRSEMAEVSVYSVTGQRVFHRQPQLLDSNYQLDLSAQQKGIYFLKVTTGNRVMETRKLVLN